MSQQTSQNRVLFPRTLAPAVSGLFAVLAISAAILGGIFMSFIMALAPQTASAAVSNSTVNFQARLEGPGGNIAADGFYNIQFKLYDAPTGGTNLWTESYYDTNGVTAGNDNRVKVVNGYVSVALGSQTAFGSTINWDQKLYLTMNVGGTTQTSTPTYDGEMSPRLALGAVPYAFRAGQLATTNTAGTLTSTLSILQPTVGNQSFQIQDQGAAGTYSLCVQSATNAAGGCAASTGAAGYIQNQIALQQASTSFWISGIGRSDTALQAPSFDTPTAVALNIGTTNATSITLGKTGVNTNVAGNLSVGTTQSFGAITIANGAWFTSLDSAGTGSVNMFSVNSSNQIQVGAALSIDGGIILPTNGGQLTLADLPIDTTATNGTKQSYTLRVGSSNALTVYGEADGAGNAQNIRVAIGSSIAPGYTLDVGGDINTTGAIRTAGTTVINAAGVLQSASLTGTYGNLTGVGALTAGTWNANTIGVQYGGTGLSSYAVGDLLYASGTTSIGQLAAVTAGSCLKSNGTGSAPVWGTCGASGSYVTLQGGTPGTADTGNINISGTGIFGTALQAPLLDANGTLGIGTGSSSTALTIGRSGQALVINNTTNNFSSGNVLINGTSTSGNFKFSITGTLNSSSTNSQYGISNSVSFNPAGASLSNVFAFNNDAIISGSALNITNFIGGGVSVQTTAGYTGLVSDARGFSIGSPVIAGSQLFTKYTGLNIGNANANSGNTTGTINNYGLNIASNTPGAGAGGTLNNYGINLFQPAGAGAGTTNNYGLYIQGAGAGAANWSIYNASAAASYYAGNITIGTTSNTNSYALNVNGTVAASTSVLTPSLDTAAAGALGIGSSTATSINLGKTSGTTNIATTVSGTALFKNNSDSTTAFQIQNAAGSSLMTANTSTMSVNINNGSLNINGLSAPAAPAIALSGGGSLAYSTTYYYRLAAYNSNDRTNAVNSSPASVTTAGSGTNRTVNVTWSAVSGATGYYLYRSTNNINWSRVTIVGGATVSAADNGANFTWTADDWQSDAHYNLSAGVNFANGGQVLFDGRIASVGVALHTGDLTLAQYRAGEGVSIIGDSLTITDNVGYNQNLHIANTGATTFRNRVNSGSAFLIQNTAESSFFTADSTNQRITTKDLNVGSAANTSSAGRLFSDSFESGDFKLWDGTVSSSPHLTADITIVRNGKYSAKFTQTGSLALADTSIASRTTVAMRGYIYVGSQGANALDILAMSNSTSTIGAYRDNVTGRLGLWNGFANVGTNSSTVMAIGVWHKVELVVTANATTGTTALYLNDVNVLSQTNVNTGNLAYTEVMIGDNISRTNTFYMDDVVVDSVRAGDSSSLNVADSLRVAGTSSFGGNAQFQAASNSTKAFQIQNSAGTSNLFVADTANSSIGIGGAATTLAKLTVVDNGTVVTNNTATDKYGLLRLQADDNDPYSLVFGNSAYHSTNGYAMYMGNTGSLNFTDPLGGDVMSLSAAGAAYFQNRTDSTSAFIIQNSAGANLFVADTQTTVNAIKIGGGDVSTNSTPVLMVLDHDTDSTDPTGTNGAMYYNVALAAFRCYQDSEWRNCSGALGTEYMEIQDEFMSQGFLNSCNFIQPLWAIYNSTGCNVANITQNSNGQSGSTHPGVLSLYTTTTSGNGSVIATQSVNYGSPKEMTFVVRIPTITTMTTRIGLIDDGTAHNGQPAGGTYFQFSSASANWRAITRNGGTETNADTTVAVTAGTWYKLTMKKNASNQWVFSINDTVRATNVATNNPTLAVGGTYGIQMITNAASLRYIDFDYFYARSARIPTRY